MVEVEAIGEFVSLDRRDLFLVGVSVATCNRRMSAVRGRIGEGGKSRRGGFELESGNERVSAIRNVRPKCEQTTQGAEDTKPGIERHFRFQVVSTLGTRMCAGGGGE